MNIINLTPHTININRHQIDEIAIEPSGTIARCEEVRTQLKSVDQIPVDMVSYGAVENLPEPQEDTIYIVSQLVAAQVPERRDVYIPGKAIRDDAGRVIGCQGLSQVPAPVTADPDAPYPDIDPWDEMGAPSPAANAYFMAQMLDEIIAEYKKLHIDYGIMQREVDNILFDFPLSGYYPPDPADATRYRRVKSLMDWYLKREAK